ncbi:MAG TPA: hypothetical protein P5243_01875 [Bacteroidales bacterium]|jgi:hypothetical protein|nr:hypothetical protein [Bacteroidales bacterium]HRS18225.1 hypothetical protein [Bacteroidales bacterium]
METLRIILLIILPSALVFATAYFSIKQFFTNEQKKRESENLIQNQKITVPIRLQAYERLILLLERINPQSLLLRIQNSNSTAGQLHNDLLIAVRAEFEHNLSQQIYISSQSWLAVKRAKEVLIKIINEEASKIAVNAPASVLSEAILMHIVSLSDNPIQIAIDTLKVEVTRFLS